jgi:hypothetical protein
MPISPSRAYGERPEWRSRPATPIQRSGGSNTISVNAQIHTQGRISATDKREIAQDFAIALRDGVDLVYMEKGI